MSRALRGRTIADVLGPKANVVHQLAQLFDFGIHVERPIVNRRQQHSNAVSSAASATCSSRYSIATLYSAFDAGLARAAETDFRCRRAIAARA